MRLVIAILVGLWLWSYIRFRKLYARDCMLCVILEREYRDMPNPQSQSEYACALMVCQKYQSALELFEELKRNGSDRQLSYLDTNIRFCKKPLPWSSGVMNHNGSWRHHFLPTRLGGRRMVAISSETYLKANAIIRAAKRKR